MSFIVNIEEKIQEIQLIPISADEVIKDKVEKKRHLRDLHDLHINNNDMLHGTIKHMTITTMSDGSFIFLLKIFGVDFVLWKSRHYQQASATQQERKMSMEYRAYRYVVNLN